MNNEKLARGLGWFSIGLGLTEVVAAERLCRALGLKSGAGLVRAFGLREIATGLGALSAREPAPWIWARVGGDILDLAGLGAALRDSRGQQDRVLAALAAVAGVTALDLAVAAGLSRPSGDSGPAGAPDNAAEVTRAITIDRPAAEVYRRWRDPATVTTMLAHALDVDAPNPDFAHIQVRGPLGKVLSWSWDVPEEEPGAWMRFRSLPGSNVPNEGLARLRPTPDGKSTQLHLQFRYRLPLGPVGGAVARPFGFPVEEVLAQALRRFKSLVETGEVPQAEAQPQVHAGDGAPT